jgi:CheY-like chemotaxis protein
MSGEEGISTRGAEQENQARASVPGNVATQTKPDEYGGYRLTSDLCTSLVSLLVGLAWPATVLLLVYHLAIHADAILNSANNFMQNKERVEISIGPKEVALKIIAAAAGRGLSQQVTAQSGPVQPEQANNLQQAAAAAATQLVPQALRRPDILVKVLWVDDHPQNNIGLQFAFQALGIIVICIDSNAAIQEAFTTAGGFDVVITDMFRDAIRDRPAEPEGGLQTASIIRTEHPDVPVIIYAGSYSAAHASEPVSRPVIADTNDTQRVFTLVTGIAAKKLK